MTQPLTIESDELAWMKSAQSRFARETPIVNLGGLDALSSAARDARFLVAKLESMQRAGSAEFRTALGAAIHVKRVYSTRPPSEFVVASAGAFGLAAAEVGPLVGVPVRIFVPADTPRVIVAELQRSPATVEVVDGDPARCPEVAKTWAARRPGVAYLDPHASPGASVGGALLAQELMAQVRRAWPLRSPKPSERSTTAARARSGSSPVAAPNLVLVSARRCGLAEAVRAYFDDSVSVIAVESEREGTENDSLASSMSRRTAPCGCASAPAGLPDGVERLAVPQIAVWHAQRVLWGGYRILVDRDAALPLAALVGADSYRPVRRARIGLVLCGAPVDPTTALACL